MVWDLCTYTGETDVDDTENADICAHGNYTSSGSVSVGFTCAQNTSTAGGMIAFKAASLITLPTGMQLVYM